MEKLDIKAAIESVVYDLTYGAELSLVLMKVQAIASKFENERLRNWYKNEIEGYRDNNNIPDYRKITAESYADIILFGGARVMLPIDISKIPDESIRELLTKAIIAKPLCEVEALSYCGEETIKLDLTSFLGQYIQVTLYPIHNVLSVYQVISKAAVKNILQRTKSTLLDLFLEMDKLQFDDTIDFNVMNTKIDKIMNKIINTTTYSEGDTTFHMTGTANTVGSGNTINLNTEQVQKLREIADQIEVLSVDVEADRESIAEEVAKIRIELDGKKNPKIIRSAFNAIKGILVGVAANKITDLITTGMALLA